MVLDKQEIKVMVIEGPDKSGKTTLAKNLADTYKYKYWQTVGVPDNFAEFKKRKNEEKELLMYTEKIVLDRSFLITEYVYSRLQNRKIYCKDKDIFELKSILKHKKIPLFLCLADYTDTKKLAVLKNMYSDLFNRINLNHFVKYMP